MLKFLYRKMNKEVIEELFLLIHEAIILQKQYAGILEVNLEKSAYDYWITDRFFSKQINSQCPEQIGQSKDEKVKWFFHGLEVDVSDVELNLNIRIEFGPRGDLNCFTASNIERLIENKQISSNYPKIRSFLNKSKSGTYWGISKILDGLFKLKLINYVEPSLVQLEKQYTKKDKDGHMVVDIPEEMLPEDESRMMFNKRFILIQ